MEVCLRPLVSWSFMNNNYLADNKMKYINLIYIYLFLLYNILSTLQIISNLVRHKPTKRISHNQHCYNIYIYIYTPDQLKADITLDEGTSNIMSAFSWSGVYIDIYISFKYPVRWQKLLGSVKSGSTALSYRNCVITLVGGWWGQNIARPFTRCMMICICVYVCVCVCVWQLYHWYWALLNNTAINSPSDLMITTDFFSAAARIMQKLFDRIELSSNRYGIKL